MKITYHYSNGKSFTAPRCDQISITRNAIRSVYPLKDLAKVLANTPEQGKTLSFPIAVGVREVYINPNDDLWLWDNDPKRIIIVNLKEVSIDRIDIKVSKHQFYEFLLSQAVDSGWRVNMRKVHNRETGYNIHITLTKPIL